MHSLLSGTTKRWKGYWLPWAAKLFLTCLFPAFSTSGSCKVWGWPKWGNSRKGNSLFDKSFTDLPSPTLCQRPELLFAILCPLAQTCPFYSFNTMLCVLLFLCRRQTLVQGLICALSISFGSCQLALQRERCCGAWLQRGCSSKVREFLAAVLCLSPLPGDGMCDPVLWALTWWTRTNWENLVCFLY